VEKVVEKSAGRAFLPRQSGLASELHHTWCVGVHRSLVVGLDKLRRAADDAILYLNAS